MFYTPTNSTAQLNSVRLERELPSAFNLHSLPKINPKGISLKAAMDRLEEIRYPLTQLLASLDPAQRCKRSDRNTVLIFNPDDTGGDIIRLNVADAFLLQIKDVCQALYSQISAHSAYRQSFRNRGNTLMSRAYRALRMVYEDYTSLLCIATYNYNLSILPASAVTVPLVGSFKPGMLTELWNTDDKVRELMNIFRDMEAGSIH
jgi:hypothetical protein